MKRNEILFSLFAVSLFLIFSTCSVEELPPATYPRVNTLEVSAISKDGATLNAEILSPGNSDVTEYGFVLGTIANPNLTNSEVVTLAENINAGGFSAQISYPLESGKKYFVRAYAKNDTFLTYGVNVVFTSLGGRPPLIESIIPNIGNSGDTITLKGSSFSFIETQVKVNMDGIKSQVIESTDTAIVCVVPNGVVSSSFPIEVTIRNTTSVSSEKFSLTVPEITSFLPKVGTYGDTLTLIGDYFGTRVEDIEVSLGENACEVIRTSQDSMAVIVPNTVDSQFSKIEVTRSSQTGSARDLFEMFAPQIDTYSTPIYSGEVMEIRGSGFNPDAPRNELNFDQYKAEVIEASGSRLQVQVPVEDYYRRNIELKLKAAGQEFSTEVQISEPWIRKKDIPGPDRYQAVMFSLGSHIYVGMGEEYSNRSYLKDFQRFDPDENRWEAVADYPEAGRKGAISFVIDGKAYVGGGRSSQYGYENSFYQYDPVTNVWTAIADFPKTQVEGNGIEVNGEGYVFSGRENLWSYDPSSDSWTEHPEQNLYRFGSSDLSIFSVDQTIYIGWVNYGGMAIVEFDLLSNQWIRSEYFPMDESLSRGAFMAFDDQVVVLTGRSVYSFDPVRRELSRLRNFEAINTSFKRTAVLNGKGYYGGGVSSNAFYEYIPDYDKEYVD
jgi:hypothetical protein